MTDYPKLLGSVCYDRPSEQQYSFEIDGTVFRIKVARQTTDVAVLRVGPFPVGFTVVDSLGVPALRLDGTYVLMCLNSYEVRYNGAPVLKIASQHQQIVYGAARTTRNPVNAELV